MMMIIIIYTDITLLATSVSVGRSWHGMLAMRPKTHASARRRRRHRVTSTDRRTDGRTAADFSLAERVDIFSIIRGRSGVSRRIKSRPPRAGRGGHCTRDEPVPRAAR